VQWEFYRPFLRVFFILHFTQIWNHHLHNLALCCPLVRTHCLCVHIKLDPAIGAPQELLNGFDILSVRLQQSAEGMPECMPANVLVDAICLGNWS
jgi:hypothetical protein